MICDNYIRKQEVKVVHNEFRINPYVESIRTYHVASHEIWTVDSENRHELLKLDWNEATISPSSKVIECLRKLTEKGDFYNFYPRTTNNDLIEAIASYVDLPRDCIQYFSSSDSLHEYICRTFLNSYCRVLIQSPSYDNFRLTAEASGAEIIYSELSSDFIFRKELFEEDIKNYRPSLVYICNPNNPTGLQHSAEYIRYLIKTYMKTVFLVDEAYWEFSGITAKDLVQKYKNILISRTFSKAFGLANFRIGYLISNPYNIKLIDKIRNPKNISSFAQEAAIAALSDQEYMWSYVEEVRKTRKWFSNELKKLEIGKVYDSSGNFILLKCCSVNCKYNLIQYLHNNGIFIRDVTQRPSVLECVRITIGTRKQMERVIHEIQNFLCEYKIREN